MLLQITHETRYDYVPPVELAQHICHLTPICNANQTLYSHSATISPEPDEQTQSIDIFGNARQFFSLQATHSQLQVTANSFIATRARAMPTSTIAWEQVRERFRYVAGGTYDPACEFVYASPFVPRHGDFTQYARPSFAPGQSLLQSARDLMRRIHTEFSYESQSTEVSTPALTALAQRKGVCQDFAHIMIACLRALGLSARYVSGYVLTQPPPGVARLRGCDASHAWASVYLPDFPEGDHWCDFDPTNNRDGWGSPGEDYVTLATGRDYGDVAPLRGVIHGGTDHTLRVAVTVEPVDDMALPMGQSQSQSQGSPLFQSQFQWQSQSQN